MFRKYLLLGGGLLGLWLAMGAFAWWRQVSELTSIFATSSAQPPEIFRREASIPGNPFELAPRMLSIPAPRRSTGNIPQLAVQAPVIPARSYSAEATAVADQFLKEHSAQWQIRPYHQLKPTVFEGPMGTTVKYGVFQDAYQIIGMSIDIVVSHESQVISVNNNYRPTKQVELGQSVLSPEEVMEAAPEPLESDSDSKSVGTVLFLNPNSDQPELAYYVPMKEKGGMGRPMQVLFRASDGMVLSRSFARPF